MDILHNLLAALMGVFLVVTVGIGAMLAVVSVGLFTVVLRLLRREDESAKPK